MTTVSNSVHAGLHSQLKAGAVNAAEYISPSMDGYVTPAGKKAMKLGDCQCVMPGMILDAMSAWISVHGCGFSGAEVGS
jgi:hypothetical protein